MSTTTLAPPLTRPARRPAARPVARPAAGSAARAAAPAGQLRLTRRGRVVVLLAGVALALAVAFFWGADSVATEQPGVDAPAQVVTVGTGETLWEIAAERTPAGGDVRDMMSRIERINVLESTALDAGQRLMVPAAG